MPPPPAADVPAAPTGSRTVYRGDAERGLLAAQHRQSGDAARACLQWPCGLPHLRVGDCFQHGRVRIDSVDHSWRPRCERIQ